MKRLRFKALDWDSGNADKALTHRVSREEIEQVLSGPVFLIEDIDHSVIEERFKAVGTTAEGRRVFVAFTFRQHSGETLVRPISARYMHDKEVARYEQTVADPDQ